MHHWHNGSMEHKSLAKCRVAFSLVETIVAIGVILILIGLALPMLGAARERGRVIRCLAQMRSHTGVLAAFAAERQDHFPNVFACDRSTRLPTMSAVTFEEYGLAGGLWHLPVLEAYGEQAFHASLVCPSDTYVPTMIRRTSELIGVPASEVVGTLNLRLSMSVFCAPEALAPPPPPLERRFLRTQTQASVVFPSQKAELFEPSFHDPRVEDPLVLVAPRRVNIAAADGSANQTDTSKVMPGVVFRTTGMPAVDDSLADAAKFDLTQHGVRGKDW